MSRSTDTVDLLQTLRATLSRSVLKKSRNDREANSASCAISRGGQQYWGAKIESDTNLLDMSSEHVALLRAIQHKDFDIGEVVTLVEGDTSIVSPLSVKILVDFGIRAGAVLSYRMVNAHGDTIFQTKNVVHEVPFYHPELQNLGLTRTAPEKNWRITEPLKEPEDTLRVHARQGLALAFPTYVGASSYGAAVITGSGTIYFGGQYSAPEKRLNIHAEMSAILAALMEGETVITHLGLISDKFASEPCNLCGCCRQFIAELSKKFGWDTSIYCFAKDTRDYVTYTIDALLPYAWSSKQWQ